MLYCSKYRTNWIDKQRKKSFGKQGKCVNKAKEESVGKTKKNKSTKQKKFIISEIIMRPSKTKESRKIVKWMLSQEKSTKLIQERKFRLSTCRHSGRSQ